MDKRMLWFVGVLIGLIIVIKTPLVFTLFAFFILGMIPGTDLFIPPWVLLITYPVLFVAIVYRIGTQPPVPNLATVETPVTSKPSTRQRKPSPKKKSAGAASSKRRASRAAI